MRIGIMGDFTEPWHTEACLAADFARLDAVTEGVVLAQHPKIGAEWDIHYLRERLRGCQLVVFVPSAHDPPHLLELWSWLRQDGATVATHHLDLYWGLSREVTIRPHEPRFATDAVFTPDGDPAHHVAFHELGIAHFWLPAAVGSDWARAGTWREEFACDVAFVGGGHGYPHRKVWPFRAELVRALEREYGGRFQLFERGVRGDDLADLCASAKVIVGDSICLPGTSRYWSDRYYEIVGRAGTLVWPIVPGFSEQFGGQHHVWSYVPGDLESALEATDITLRAGEDVRRVLAERAQAHIRRRHTYVQRAQEMLDALRLP